MIQLHKNASFLECDILLNAFIPKHICVSDEHHIFDHVISLSRMIDLFLLMVCQSVGHELPLWQGSSNEDGWLAATHSTECRSAGYELPL